MWKRICAGLLGCSMLAGVSAGMVSAAPGPVKNVQESQALPAAQQGDAKKNGQGGTGSPATQPPASQAPKAQEAAPATAPKEAAASKEKKIVINIASRSLALYQGNEKIRLYPLGLGKPHTPTPTGYYKIRSKDVNPTWTDPSDTSIVIPSGENNPLGYRWMHLFGHYGIHGTNRPDSIGHYVSNGCIRMREADVEALFDMVDVGTPVEITYNRVVVEKTPDDTVAYYIYPDGYNRQSLDVPAVDKWLSGYGVSGFESNEAIQAKIAASDGQPTFIGKVYNVFVDGKKIPGKAVAVDNVTYLPAADLAQAAKMNVEWKAEGEMLVTPYGMAKGYNKKNVLYCNAADTMRLFHLEGALDATKSYMLKTKAAPMPEPVPARPSIGTEAPSPSTPVRHNDKPVLVYEKGEKASAEEAFQ